MVFSSLAFVLLLMCVVLFKDVQSLSWKNFTLGGELITAEELIEQDDYSQCFVSVVVHDSPSFEFGLPNAVLTALSRRLNEGPKYSQGNTNKNGQVCLPVECTKDVRLFVEKNGLRIPALNKTMQQRNVPVGYQVQFETGNEVIKFQAFAWGSLEGKNGPVYNVYDKDECMNAALSDYHFVFSYISIPDRLYATPVPETGIQYPDPRLRYMWRYGVEKTTSVPRTCFMKIKFKVDASDVNVTASSYEDDARGILLGTFTTGPLLDLNSSNAIDKAACVEYRCPIKDIDDETIVHNTHIQGSIHVPGMPSGCCFRVVNGDFNATATSFWTITAIQEDVKGGSLKGLYMHENPQTARRKCFNGQEIIHQDSSTNVNNGIALEYNCIPGCSSTPAPAPTPAIVG